MNFNLFFHLYETTFTPLGIPTPSSLRGQDEGWGRAGHNGKKVYFKMLFKRIKVFLCVFFNGEPVDDLPRLSEWKLPLFFFLKPSL